MSGIKRVSAMKSLLVAMAVTLGTSVRAPGLSTYGGGRLSADSIDTDADSSAYDTRQLIAPRHQGLA